MEKAISILILEWNIIIIKIKKNTIIASITFSMHLMTEQILK
jgi:hypothetical protein